MSAKRAIRILLYLSLGFFVWALYRMDYLVLAKARPHWPVLAASLLLLFAGFVLSALSWWFILRKHGVQVAPARAIVSHGLSVFAKYIPGKLWVVVGRASLVQATTGKALRELSFISLREQFIYILLGLLLSVGPVYLLWGPGLYFLVVVLTMAALALLLFSPAVHRTGLHWTGKLFKKKMDIPLLSVRSLWHTGLAVLLYWLVWSAAFYLLLVSIVGPLPPITAFAFPLSVTFGMLAIILPGGIGVRESIITAFLATAGVSLEMAITLSVISRLWFVAGEVFFFLLALALRGFRRQVSGVRYEV